MVVLVAGAGFSDAVGIPATKYIFSKAIDVIEANLARHPLSILKRPRVYGRHRNEWEDSVREQCDQGQLDSLRSLDQRLENAQAYRRLCEATSEPVDIEDLASFAFEGGDGKEWLSIFADADLEGLPYEGVGNRVFHRVAELECSVIAAHDNSIQASQIDPIMSRVEHDLGTIEAIVTLNYDTLPEKWVSSYRPLHRIEYGINPEPLRASISEEDFWPNYQAEKLACTEGFQPQRGASFPILKLHGALNLAYCPVDGCRSTLVTADSSAFHNAVFDDDPVGHLHLPIAYHCPPVGPPVPGLGHERRCIRRLLVPPVSKKNVRPEWQILASVQERARRCIDAASCILFAGLGFRREDIVLDSIIKAINTERTEVWAACGSHVPSALIECGARKYGNGYL